MAPSTPCLVRRDMACKGLEWDLREDAPNIGYRSNLGWIPLGRKKKKNCLWTIKGRYIIEFGLKSIQLPQNHVGQKICEFTKEITLQKKKKSFVFDDAYI